MVDFIPIAAELRERAGKGAARSTRREGRVPAVIYGNKQEPVLISLDPVELKKQFRGGTFFSHVYEIEVGDEKAQVLARDLQLHPVTDEPIHVDFMRFSPRTKLSFDIPVHFENEEASPGLRSGGVLNVVRHTVELLCSPLNIPEFLTADLSGLDVGDGIHISNITLPEGVTPTITDRDFTIATIAAPTVYVEEEPEDEDAEGVEGEDGEEAEGEDSGEGGDAEEGDGGDDD
ncbi:MAG: 50S ribosomal protein L25/general stress protein Ctc [Rhodospirillales bacterium]